jgi:hypothetical protein
MEPTMNIDSLLNIFPDTPEAELATALNAIDQGALQTAEAPRWTHEVWDRTSSINGTPAADVLAQRNDIPATGDVVIVKRDNVIVFFQPHEAEQAGFVPIADGAATGAAMATRCVTDSVDAEIVGLVTASL